MFTCEKVVSGKVIGIVIQGEIISEGYGGSLRSGGWLLEDIPVGV